MGAGLAGFYMLYINNAVAFAKEAVIFESKGCCIIYEAEIR